jgi:uncharacterized membrane protein
MPLAVQRVLFYLGMPIAMLAALMLIETAMFYAGKRKRAPSGLGMGGRLARGMLVVAFFFLTPVLHIIFSMFACVHLDSPIVAPYQANAVGCW